MLITIKYPGGKSKERFEASDTLKTVKAWFTKKEDVPADKCVIKVDGNPVMDDSKTLGELGVKDGAELQISLRLGTGGRRRTKKQRKTRRRHRG